jgi:ABC-type cobalamin transport system ATPase subunit
MLWHPRELLLDWFASLCVAGASHPLALLSHLTQHGRTLFLSLVGQDGVIRFCDRSWLVHGVSSSIRGKSLLEV